MEAKPDTIKVSAFHREEIFASHADLHVTVKGSSVVSGDAAMKKAKEVNQLLEALQKIGVEENAVQLQGVQIETSSGALLKTSSAAYRLKIRCADLNQLAGMLDAVGSQKNAALDYIEWKYDEDAARERGLLLAAQKAKSKARQVADALGVKLIGVYDFIESSHDDEPPHRFAMQAKAMRAAEMSAEPSLEMDARHSKMIYVNVDVWYRVSPV